MTKKNTFSEGWSWFKFNDLEPGLRMVLHQCSKKLKVKVRRFWGLLLTFVEVTEEKLVAGPFCPTPLILNKVNH